MSLNSRIIGLLLFSLLISGCIGFAGPEVRDDVVVTSVPEYFVGHLKEKEELINSSILQAGDDYAALLFFTDSHWGDNRKVSPSLINHIIHSTPVEDVVFGGDVITTWFSDPERAVSLGESFRQAYDRLDCNMYYLVGNHDNNSDGHPDDVQYHLSDEEVFDYLQKGMGECIYGEYFSFYFDRPASRTRFICLDTGRYYYSQFRDKLINTAEFLVNSLNDTPEGWRIVVLSHLWCNLDYEKPRRPYMPDFIRSITNIMDDFNAGANGVFEYGGTTLEYAFTEESSRIITCIGGHCHLDCVLYTEGGIPVISTATDSQQTVNNESARSGTVNESALSVFVFDYTNDEIDMIRIGRGHDLSLPIE